MTGVPLITYENTTTKTIINNNNSIVHCIRPLNGRSGLHVAYGYMPKSFVADLDFGVSCTPALYVTHSAAAAAFAACDDIISGN